MKQSTFNFVYGMVVIALMLMSAALLGFIASDIFLDPIQRQETNKFFLGVAGLGLLAGVIGCLVLAFNQWMDR